MKTLISMLITGLFLTLALSIIQSSYDIPLNFNFSYQSTVNTPQGVDRDSLDTWITCRNEYLGYEFRYPSTWHIYHYNKSGMLEYLERSCSSFQEPIVIVSPVSGLANSRSEYVQEIFKVSVHEQPFPASEIGTIYDYLERSRGFRPIYKITTVDNETAVWDFKDFYPEGSMFFVIQMLQDNKLISLSSMKISSKLRDEILSTFHFIED